MEKIFKSNNKGQQLLVSGCSFSDYTKVDKVYGEYLAEKLNIKTYIHEARGCSSNYRIWRTVSNSILNNKISKNDIIIIQYTSEERQEIWSPYEHELIDIKNDVNMTDPYNEGTLLRFKYHSHSWQSNRLERKFMKLYEKFINHTFELEKFRVNHSMFQTFLLYHGFKNVYFLKGGGYGPMYSLIKEYENNYIDGSDLLKNHLLNDKYHLNEKGHKETAELIYNFIKQKGKI